jgi:hypothetical protein
MTMEHDDKEAVPDAAPEGAIPPPEAGAPPVQEPSGVPAGAEPATGDSAPGDAAAAAVPEAGGGTPEPAPVAEGDAPEAPAAPPAEAAKPATRTPLDIRRVIEALLFSCDAPLTPAKIRDAIPRISAQAIRDAIDLLKAEYAQAGRAFELVEIAEGFQILTRPEYDDWIARLKKARAQAKLSDFDLFEVNEAFAPQYLAVEKELGLPREQTNVDGGAIAVGHPLGASGARITMHLMYELRRRRARFGLGGACIGGGQGIAVALEIL